jgi:general secretion pathway protein E
MINSYIIDYTLSKKLGFSLLKKHQIFPIQKQDLFILIASSNQQNNELFLTTLFDMPIKFITVSKQSIQNKLLYYNIESNIHELGINASFSSFNNNSNNSYIIDMLDKIILYAIQLKSSDIHIESLKKSVIIRFRIDGILNLMFTFKYNMYNLFTSIIKLFAHLDISQTRLPQNGRFSKIFNAKEFDFRVSTIPTIDGESIVVRILDNKNANISLDKIGFNDYTLTNLNKLIYLHQGMILVTGPTGSGKTTTLYSILNDLNSTKKKIITIEDPIEYNLEGIQQININEDIQFDYSLALKNILRQDPDIIMIGEIRDEKALNIALQASLTGHLVIATLHTNNAPETINRLLDLKAKPFLISSTLKAILSQRLVRKLCSNCQKESKSIGCNRCNNTGYKGRVVVSEFLKFDNKISQYIHNSENITKIISYAKTKGYQTLEENTKIKIKNHITSYEEYYAKVKM